MSRLSKSNRSALIRLASSLPKGDESRRTILAELKIADQPVPDMALDKNGIKTFQSMLRQIHEVGEFDGNMRRVFQIADQAVREGYLSKSGFSGEYSLTQKALDYMQGLRRTARVEFHVEYVSNSTLRLMVSDRTSSTFFEARVGPNASVELSEKAAQAGFRISPEIIEEEIEQK